MSTPNVWFTSDNHFGHRNMTERFVMDDGRRVRHEFQTMEECDEAMIHRWNSVIKPEDKVYHLGDFAMSKEIVAKVMPRLMGNIRLLLGNHDPDDPMTWIDRSNPEQWRRRVQKLGSWKMFGPLKGAPIFVACHYPLHPMCLVKHHEKNFQLICVHGHEHRNKVMMTGNRVLEKFEDQRYINICVENTNYTPIHYDEIAAIIKKRGF